jgi:hypothetical protein
MRARAAVPFVIVAAVAGCVLPARTTVMGRQVWGESEYQWSGSAELLAVTADTLWLWKGQLGLIAVPTSVIRQITVDKHRFGARMTFSTMAATGGVTGILLTSACSTVEDASCATVLPVWMAMNLLVGAVIAIPMHYSSQMKIPVGETERLRAYARYPQGLPDAVRTSLRR